jgi:glycogen debranching enzyme
MLMAAELQTAALEQFWMPDAAFFAMAMDYHPETDATRLLKTITSTPLEALETGIFENLPSVQKQQYLQSLARVGFSEKMLTPIGIRTMDVGMQELVPYWFYHGPTAVWTMPNNVQAIGWRRYGIPDLARAIEIRQINYLNTGFFPEFGLVSPEGIPDLDHQRRYVGLQNIPVKATNTPEGGQAWSVSGGIRMEKALREDSKQAWYSDSEWFDILQLIPQASLLQGPALEEWILSQSVHFAVDKDAGKRAEKDFVSTH